jgi:NAD(P)-dependent dehydrogenase (short-subunit alcohol dehydrogenase family)
MARMLAGKVAVVTGASRGAGRGIALALGDAGATVYVTGRTSRGGPTPADGAPGTIEETAEDVTARGGQGIFVRVDHTIDADVAALFERVRDERGGLDILANAVWGAGDGFMEDMQSFGSRPFWDQPDRFWHQTMAAGAYAYFAASRHAAALMSARSGGLIVHVSEPTDPAGAGFPGQLCWDLAHDCINRMVRGMSLESKPAKIAVIGLLPGFMRTERVLMSLTTDELKRFFGFDRSESPEYLGRAVAALAADRDILVKTGHLLNVADVASEYGFTDIDGRHIPRFEAKPS